MAQNPAPSAAQGPMATRRVDLSSSAESSSSEPDQEDTPAPQVAYKHPPPGDHSLDWVVLTPYGTTEIWSTVPQDPESEPTPRADITPQPASPIQNLPANTWMVLPPGGTWRIVTGSPELHYNIHRTVPRGTDLPPKAPTHKQSPWGPATPANAPAAPTYTQPPGLTEIVTHWRDMPLPAYKQAPVTAKDATTSQWNRWAVRHDSDGTTVTPNMFACT